MFDDGIVSFVWHAIGKPSRKAGNVVVPNDSRGHKQQRFISYRLDLNDLPSYINDIVAPHWGVIVCNSRTGCD